jgi:HPt (histidine-containing phosphotransfer) domain-containing protein
MIAKASLSAHVIDEAQVAELIEAIGIDDFFDIVATLEDEVGAQISALEAQSSAHQRDHVRLTAHRLAGLLSQFGAFKVAECAERLRQARDTDEADRLAASMVGLCRASMAALAHLHAAPNRASS